MALTFTRETVPNSQSQNFWQPPNTSLLQFVAGVAYYISVSQTGNASTGDIVIQNRAGGVWHAAVDFAGRQPGAISATAVGTVIYILVPGNVATLTLYRFQTTTGLFLADSAGPADSVGDAFAAIGPFTDGKMLVSYRGSGSREIRASVYDPVANSWAASVQLATEAAGSIDVVGQAIQQSTATGFVFWANSTDNALSVTVKCISVTEALALGVSQAVAVVPLAGSGYGGIQQIAIGTPAVVNDPANPFLLIPILNPAHAGPPTPGFVNLHVYRATPATNPAFADELALTLAGGNLFQTFIDTSASGLFDAAILDQAGVAYCFFVTDNGNQDGATSQAQLQVISSSVAGVWTAPASIYMTPVSKELTSPFLGRDGNGKIAIIINQFDPAIWQGGGDQYPALSTFFFFQPVGGGGTFQPLINLNPVGIQTVGLPFIFSCCALCDQPQRTGLQFPMMLDKDVMYARTSSEPQPEH